MGYSTKTNNFSPTKQDHSSSQIVVVRTKIEVRRHAEPSCLHPHPREYNSISTGVVSTRVRIKVGERVFYLLPGLTIRC